MQKPKSCVTTTTKLYSDNCYKVVPEFPLVLPIAAAAIATAIMFARKIKAIECSPF
jgi:hypothetical protein